MALAHIARNFIKKPSPAVLGLDIQARTLRLLQLLKKGDGFEVGYILTIESSFALVNEEAEIQDSLMPLLLEMVHEHGLADQLVVIGVPMRCVQFKRKHWPEGWQEEEVQRDVNDPDAVIDFAIIEPSLPGYIDGVVASTRKSMIQQWQSCMTQVGLRLKIIDIDMYALVRAVCRACQWRPAQNQLSVILYCQPDKLSVIVFNEKTILLHNDYVLSKVINAKQFIKKLLKEIQSTYPSNHFSPLMVCGENMMAFIEEEVVVCAQPFLCERIPGHITIPQDAHHYWVATGLAMREISLW